MPKRSKKAEREKLAIRNAEELLKLPKVKPLLKARLIELLLKNAQEERQLQDDRERRREERLDQTAELVRLRTENKRLRDELEALKKRKPEATPKPETAIERAKRLLETPGSQRVVTASTPVTRPESIPVPTPPNPCLEQNETLMALRDGNRPQRPMPATLREEALEAQRHIPVVTVDQIDEPKRTPVEETEPDYTASLPSVDIEDVIPDERETRIALIRGIDALLN